MEGFLWCPHCGAPHTLDSTTCPSTGQSIAQGPANQLRGLRPGTLIAGKYKVRARVADEHAAMLYDAQNTSLGRRVIVKLVQTEGVDEADRDAEVVEMTREAYAACLIEHPNVGQVLDFSAAKANETYLVREFSSSMALASRLRSNGMLSVEDAADVLTQILSGLDTLHRAKIVHRDLGSHTLWVADRLGCRPLIKIGGLGRCTTAKLGQCVDPPTGAHYTSPEMLRGEGIDERSDLFACGVILYEMLFGRRPFEAATPAEVTRAILEQNPPPASKLRDDVDAQWVQVLDRALMKDPAKRFQSANDFLRALPNHVPIKSRQRKLSDASELGGEDEIQATAVPSSAPRSLRFGAPMGSKCDRHIGRRLAKKYEVEALLGSGSAGAVYKATHVDLRRPVAVKILHDWNRTSQQFVERFRAEAFAAGKLDHPNITRVVDCGHEPDGTLYMVMEYVAGRSLESVIVAEGYLEQERAVRIGIQIVGALSVAHAAGIVHRDVKPENVMVVNNESGKDTKDRIKVCDFGLAKLFDGSANQELTRQGVLLGSPAYMSPEQIKNEPATERTDVYGAGVTLFELLTGRLPHEAQTHAEMFTKKLHEPAYKPTMFVAIDPLLEDIVMHAIEPDPKLRHASTRELYGELKQFLEEIRLPPSSTNVVNVSIAPPSSS